MTIEIKDIETLKSVLAYPAHPMLSEIAGWVAERCGGVFITCFYESRDYTSVHATIPVRGLDIRHTIYRYPPAVVEIINREWQYDPNRPDMQVALLHDSGRGRHIHLQVCDATRLRPNQQKKEAT